MNTKKTLQLAVKVAQEALNAAESALYAFETSAENNVFESIEVACKKLQHVLYERASDDCEGSYNCGDEEYTQEFIVDGVKYIASLKCEYNRHDKTYYYIDGHKFSYKIAE